MGYRESKVAPVPEELARNWARSVKDILKLPEPTEDDAHYIRLDAAAEAAFEAYRDQVEVRLRPGGDLHDIVDWGNKLLGTVARAAGALRMALHAAGERRPWETPVTVDTLERAVRLGEYYASHAMVAFTRMGLDEKVKKAQIMLGFIKRLKQDRFSERDLWQNARRQFTKPSEMAASLEALAEMHYIRRVPAPARDGPGRKRGTLKKCVNSQAVYPLSETTRAQGPREEIHRLWEREALGAGRSQGRSGTSWRTGFEVRSRS